MVIEMKNILKRFKELVALDHFHLEVEAGEIYGLLGPNGSGKTTAIQVMLALLPFEKGSVHLFDRPMSFSEYDIKARIGYVPQEVSVIDELTVEDNIDFFCGLYVADRKQRKALVQEAMEFVGLTEFRKFYPKKLSGGLKRRLNIACGIAHKPDLIIFDEPTVAVDPQSRNSILEGIERLNQQGATILYTSHYMEEVEQLCNRITVMDKGRNLITGTKEELTASVGLKDTLTIAGLPGNGELTEQILKLPNVIGAERDGDRTVVSIEKNTAIGHVIQHLETNNVFYENLSIQSPTLNDVFLAITGKELRDRV